MKFCESHLQDMGKSIRHHGFWKYVNPDPDHIKGFAARWLLGRAEKYEIDPLVVLMLEIGAKAVGNGMSQKSGRCPLCYLAALTLDHTQPQQQIDGYMEQVIRPLMETNGLKPGGPGYRPTVLVVH